jgi:hypothetical protein
MPETSFVQKFISQAPHSEPSTEWRRGFLVERDGSGQAFSVSVRDPDGREANGFSASLYVRHNWLDRNVKRERLLLIFSHGGILVEGQHLQRGLDAAEECKLRRIQIHDSGEIALIKSHNADIRKPDEKEPLVSRVVISPSMQYVLENDENLAEIAKVLKEEYGNNTGSDQSTA